MYMAIYFRVIYELLTLEYKIFMYFIIVVQWTIGPFLTKNFFDSWPQSYWLGWCFVSMFHLKLNMLYHKLFNRRLFRLKDCLESQNFFFLFFSPQKSIYCNDSPEGGARVVARRFVASWLFLVLKRLKIFAISEQKLRQFFY